MVDACSQLCKWLAETSEHVYGESSRSLSKRREGFHRAKNAEAGSVVAINRRPCTLNYLPRRLHRITPVAKMAPSTDHRVIIGGSFKAFDTLEPIMIEVSRNESRRVAVFRHGRRPDSRHETPGTLWQLLDSVYADAARLADSTLTR